ncbi:MAG: 16S rRNA processing protein RimM [Eubacteriaceae bacterium]|nr:16S rRNA processing protein RimM [Eubacteriaceae bacterium]
MKKKDYMVVGKIVAPHGIKGEMKVMPITDDMERFDDLKEVYIEIEGARETFKVDKVRYHKNMVLITFKEIRDRNQTERLKNKYIEIDRKDARELDEGRYYIVDLIGIDIMENGQKIGILKDIIQSGGADLYIIQTPEKELMLPATHENIGDIDIEAGIMHVNIPEGIWDL